MNICLDYDDTFTHDPETWLTIARTLRIAGHRVIGATMRYPAEAGGMDKRYEEACERIFFTGRRAKQAFLHAHGDNVDVWIDDAPHWILTNAVR